MHLFTRKKEQMRSMWDKSDELEMGLLDKRISTNQKPQPRKISRMPTVKTASLEKIQENKDQNETRSNIPQQQTSVDNKSNKLEESLPRFGPCYGIDQPSMLDTKDKCFEHVLKKTSPDDPSKAKEVFLATIRKVEQAARNLYVDIDCSSSEFRFMMLKDGCFFLQLALLILGTPERLEYPSNNLIFGKKPTKRDAKRWMESMFFAGNQIPLVVLKELMAQQFFKNVIGNGKWDAPPESTLCRRVLYKLIVSPSQSDNQPSDLLHGLHELVIGPGPIKKKSSIQEPDYDDMEEIEITGGNDLIANIRGSTHTLNGDHKRIFDSAIDLDQSGIYIKKLKSGGVRSISFNSYYLWAVLYLPVLPVDDDLEMIFRNLRTYESSQQGENPRGEVNSYLRFMSDIVQTSNDVKLLQRGGIIKGNPDYGDDLPEMLRRLSYEDTPLTHDFRILRRKIRDYSGPPWARIKSILNVVAFLTLVQTVFSILAYVQSSTSRSNDDSIGVLSAVSQRLKHLRADDFSTVPSSSFRDQVKELILKLNTIQKFLITNTNYNSQAVNLAYEVEDAVESFYLHETQPQNKWLPFNLSLIYTPFASLCTKVDKFVRLIELENTSGETPPYPKIDFQDTSLPSETIVGMDEAFESLQYLLLNDDDRFPLASTCISICGKGGIGKTTLARKLFDSSAIAMEFHGRAWVQVTKLFDGRGIAGSILRQLSSSESVEEEEIDGMETTELMERLYKAQQGRRCLIVLDDVLDEEAWETIRFAFALDQGTRIILTTRMQKVARMGMVSKMGMGHVYEMQLLNDEQSWELFVRQLQQVNDLVTSGEQKAVMKTIVKNVTRGVPLAVTVLGGMVRGKLLDWIKKLQGFEQENDEDQAVQQILSSSYENLPFQLKTCFLYLGLFPDDQDVPIDKLCLMWMAEGLISAADGGDRTRFDIAKHYLKALVQRRLVTVQKENFTVCTTVKSCKLHDVICSLCIHGGKDGFLGVVGFKKRENSRRIAIHLDNHKLQSSVNISEPKNIRSLFLFESVGPPGESWPREMADLREFRHARVLDFDGVDLRFRKLPRGIEKLVYLRYLSFRGCHLEKLPSSFSNFPFLETLDLRVRTSCQMIIPDILSKMSCLLHLYFPISFQSASNVKLRLDGLKRLEILENFHAGMCDANDPHFLENLRIFKGTADGNNDDVMKMIEFINRNQHWHNSSLSIRSFDSYSTERRAIVKGLLTCNSLQDLDIEGHLGELSYVGCSLHFTQMIFNGSEFEEDPIPILGKLPNLRSLVLCNDAFIGKTLVCTEEDFPALRILKLLNLWSLEDFVVETGAMPFLASFTVDQCNKLQTLPAELMEIATLQYVQVRHMAKEFLDHVLVMAEEQRSSGSDMAVHHLL